MQGIEILTSAQVATDFIFNWSAFWTTFGIVLFICLVEGFMSIVCDDEDWAVMIFMTFVGVVIGSLIGGAIGKLCETPIKYETQYKVTISEEVKMNEFHERYEILEQDGKIFTIREKNNNE